LASKKLELKGKTVVITGASGGLGSLTALAFARRGAKLVVSGRNLEALKKVADQATALGAEAHIVPADVTRMDEVKALVDKAVELTGGLEVMVLGAGFAVLGEAENIPLELFRQEMEVNFWGVIHGFYAALPHFKKQGHGQFIIVNSLSGKISMLLFSAYCASKFALWGFADAARTELRRKNIDLLCLYPGPLLNEFQAHVVSPDYAVPRDMAWKLRGERPERIAEKIAQASERRKPEMIFTVWGNFCARFLPMSYRLAERFRKISFRFSRLYIKPKP